MTILVALAALVLFVGQYGRDLFAPDDTREAEVAREMWEGGDYVVPHLAGVPFVEKPPGFQAVVAAAFALAGGPSILAARAVSVLFACLTLLAVFLLARRVMSLEGASLAVATLALSARFCRTAHDILLDNALTAASAFALLFLWIALEATDPRRKRRAYAASALCIGLSFLVKGFVGPALFVAGFSSYLIASRRIDELRHAVRPLAAAAFLVPVLAWTIPFVSRATPELLRTFFIDNHLGRAVGGYESIVRPFYYYAGELFAGFQPAGMLLPFAAVAAWRLRKTSEGRPAFFFLTYFVGPFVLLSISRAKASTYIVPAYPALAVLVAWWGERALRTAGAHLRWGVAGVGILTFLAAAVAIGATVALGGMRPAVVASSVALLAGGLAVAWALKRGAFRAATVGSAAFIALGWIHWFTGPIARAEYADHCVRDSIDALLPVAGDREVFLYRQGDGIRGGVGFYRNRTAIEVDDPSDLDQRLLRDPRAVAIVRMKKTDRVPQVLADAASGLDIDLVEEMRTPFTERDVLVLVRAKPRASAGPHADHKASAQSQ